MSVCVSVIPVCATNQELTFSQFVGHPGFQNEPRQMFKNFVFKTAQTSSIADRLIFSARFSLIKHARH